MSRSMLVGIRTAAKGKLDYQVTWVVVLIYIFEWYDVWNIFNHFDLLTVYWTKSDNPSTLGHGRKTQQVFDMSNISSTRWSGMWYVTSLTRQYQFIQTQFRGAHCSYHAANKKLTKLRTKKTVRYDIYNSLFYDCPRQLLTHFSAPS